MKYKVMLHQRAVKFLEGLDERTRDRIKRSLRQLQVEPIRSRSGADIKRLVGTKGRQDLFRLRVGDFRVIYAIEGGAVWVAEIFSRGKGYRT
jgi:mRNA interferase RelE/StbE